MNKYQNDVRELYEILKIISKIPDRENNQERAEQYAKMLCENSDDDYLQQRGEAFKHALETNQHFKELLGYLDLSECYDNLSAKKYFNSYCNEKRKNADHKYNIIDLFCGAGGLSLGFVQEGFGINFACDIQDVCIETYRFNHPDTYSQYIIQGDIKTIEDDIQSYLSDSNVDLVVGGPPCQGFSNANRQRIIDDPRNKLYKSYVHVVEQVKPKFFVMENVRGMFKVSNQIIDDFESIGYQVKCELFNAKNFGVPQNRERLIFIGTRLDCDLNKIFEQIRNTSHTNYVLKDAIGDLKPLEASKQKNKTKIISEKTGGIVTKSNISSFRSDYVDLINNTEPYNQLVTFNHQARYNNDRDIEIFSRLDEGDKADDPKIADIMPYKNRMDIFKDKYYRLKMNEISKTITAHMKFDCNMYIHPEQARGLTPREAARIQSYPDNYIFKGAFTKTYMQIGNSVPPLLGRAIAKVIKEYLIS